MADNRPLFSSNNTEITESSTRTRNILHTAYHASYLASTVATSPLSLAKGLIGAGGTGRHILISANGHEQQVQKKDAANGDSSFNVLDFFGFAYNADPRLKGLACSTEQYTSPLYNGYYQTIYMGTMGSYPYESIYHEREETSSAFDGNPLYVEWAYAGGSKATAGIKGIIAVVPGLTSNACSSYIQAFAKYVLLHGYHVVVLETRGMATTPVTTGRNMSAAFVKDVSYLLEDYLTDAYLVKKFGGEAALPIMAVGFSMGGSLLAQHLSTVREKTHVHCGIALGSPFDLHVANEAIASFWSRQVFRSSFADSLAEMVDRVGPNLLEHCEKRIAANSYGPDDAVKQQNDLTLQENLSRILECRRNGTRGFESVYEFDKLVQCPLHGFEDPRAYYTAGSSLTHLHKIEVPMLCFAIGGDPIVGEPLPIAVWDKITAANPNVLYMCAPGGGHLGCLGTPAEEASNTPNFLCKRVLKVLDEAVSNPRRAPVRREVPERIEGVSLLF